MRQRCCRVCERRQHPNQFPKTEEGRVTHFCLDCLRTIALKRAAATAYARQWRAKNPHYYKRNRPIAGVKPV